MKGEREGARPGQPSATQMRLDLDHVAGLRSLRAVNDLKLDRLAFLERPEAVALNCGVVNEYVTPRFAFDEPVALGVVEPLDLACNAHSFLPCNFAASWAADVLTPEVTARPGGTKKAALAAGQPGPEVRVHLS
jgi:hypothetical protein